MPALLINGVDAETYGFTLSEAPGWSDMPESQVATAPVIGRQGVKDLADPQEQPRKLSLRGMVRGSSVADARTKLDALKLALAAKPVQFTFADQPTRYINARRTSFTSPPLTGSLVQGAMPVDATFICSDPYFYDSDLSGALLWYQPGDTITGENYSRASIARQMDVNGVWQSVAINTKRDSHYIAGVRTLLLENQRINSCTRSWDLTNAAWGKTNATAALNAVGIDGTPNTATTCTDSDAANIGLLGFSVGVAADNATHAVTFWVKKDADQSRFPLLYAFIGGGTTVSRGVYLNTQTGAVQVGFILGTGTHRVVDEITRWRVEITLTNNSTVGNTGLNAQIYPARGTVFGVDSVAATGSVAIENVNMELNSLFGSSPILTNGATVTRSADFYSVPFVAPPQEMTMYAKFTELGTFKGTGGVVTIVDSTGLVNPRFLLYSATSYNSGHQTPALSVTSVTSLNPAIADTVELQGALFANGSTQASGSINGGATVAAAQTAANALAGAWSAQLAWLNSFGTISVGFAAIQSIRIYPRVRPLSDMRALARMPLGTGVVRPLVRITGAAANPVITLYNKAGVAVASISLTITDIAGDILEIDMDAKTVKKNGVSSIASITAGDFFSIDPADQTNFGGVGPSINSSSGAVSVDYRRTWR